MYDDSSISLSHYKNEYTFQLANEYCFICIESIDCLDNNNLFFTAI